MKTRNDYKKLAKEFNEYVEASKWDNPKMILAELTGFFEGVHRVSSGRNGVSQLMELQTQLIEVDAVHFEVSHDSPSIKVYLKSNVKNSHGFGRYEPTLIQLRDSKNRRLNFSVIREWNLEDYKTDRFKSIFGYELNPEIFPQEFKSFKAYEDLEEGQCEKRAFAEYIYKGIISELEDSYRTPRSEKLTTLCKALGFKLDGLFKYSTDFYIYPKYVKKTKNGIEFGWETNSTYNSLPMTLKLTKSQGPKVEKLSSLGVESAGYYSHSDQMLIRADQAQDAKKFKRKFEATKKKMIQDTLDAVKEAA